MMDAHRVDIGSAGGHPSEARLLLVLDRELEEQDATAVFEHLHTCAACRATFERFSRLSSEVEAYSRAWATDGAAVAATATPHRETRQRPWSWRGVRISSPSAALATAAAVLLLIATWLLLARSGSAPGAPALSAPAANATAANATAASTPAPNATASRPAPGRGQDIALASSIAAPDASASSSSSSSASSDIATSMAPPKARRRPARAAAVAQARPTYYWALPYSNGALPLSEGSVVMRVRLSRDQLRLAGIPVSESQDTQNQALLRAKVLVGADGLPRAIALDQN